MGRTSLAEMLDSYDFELLDEPQYVGSTYQPNDEQRRFMEELTERYSVDGGLTIQAAIHQLLSRVLDEMEGDSEVEREG